MSLPPSGQLNDASFLDRRVDLSARSFARLKADVTLAQARAEMDSIAQHLALAYPEADKNVGISVISMKQDFIGKVTPLLMVLLGAVGFLLLIACANVAGLLLPVRSMRRSGEFRCAPGGGRRCSGRIVSQLLTESLILAVFGGLSGLLMAFFGTRAALRFLPDVLPRSSEVSVDTRGAAVYAGHFVAQRRGLWTRSGDSVCPEQICWRCFGEPHLGQEEAVDSFSHSWSRQRSRCRSCFLVGAGLMLRSFAALLRVDPG